MIKQDYCKSDWRKKARPTQAVKVSRIAKSEGISYRVTAPTVQDLAESVSTPCEVVK